MKITPTATISLTHRNYFLVQACENDAFLAASEEGEFTVFSASGEVIWTGDLSQKLNAIAYHLPNELLAYATSKGLFIQNHDGEIRFHQKGNYDSLAIFDDLLWAVQILSSNSARVEVYDRITLELIAAEELIDKFRDSSYMIQQGWNGRSITCWQAAGQDGSCNFFIELVNSQLICSQFLKEDTYPISFERSGELFFTYTEEEVFLYKFPDLSLKVAKQFQVDEIYGIEGLVFQKSFPIIFYIKAGLYLLKEDDLSLMDELIIIGHEPSPPYHNYLNFPDEGVTTDIFFIQLEGDFLLLSCRDNRAQEKGYSIEIIPIADLKQKFGQQLRLDL